MIAKLLGKYLNGNYTVSIYSDGTKIRETNSEVFDALFPESIDLKITNWCNVGCSFCHEGSSVRGKHGPIMSLEFLKTLHPYTEVSIGGGDPLSHPQLIQFLWMLKEKNVIANLTVNMKSLISQRGLVDYLVRHDLIKGLGVSITEVSEGLLSLVKSYKNSVLHIVNGVVPVEEFRRLYDQGVKVLILGYKHYRRGIEFYCENLYELRENMYSLYTEIPEALNNLPIVSFDNLALKQLGIKRLLSEDEWELRFMGKDGFHTMYIDAVDQTFAKNSTSSLDRRYPLHSDINHMFSVIKDQAICDKI